MTVFICLKPPAIAAFIVYILIKPYTAVMPIVQPYITLAYQTGTGSYSSSCLAVEVMGLIDEVTQL